MGVLLLAKELLVGAAIIVLVGIAVMAFMKFLRSQEGKRIIRQRQISGSNRAQRRKEKAISRRKRN